MSGDSYFYAMEFVDGESLDKVIRRSGRLDPSTAMKVTALVAAGLEAIHKQNLIHRDIKPSNIMVSFDGDKIVNAKIIDLGLAKGTVEDDAISAISSQGIFAGTPAYASPEQFAGIGADIRSDLYSLGITLWEMLAGEVPFKGSTSRLIYQHQHAAPPVDKLTHVPQPVIGLLEVLLKKDPVQRLQTPTELLEAIPKVTEALDSGRRATTDQLRLVADQIAGRPKQLTGHPLLTGTRMRAFGWLLASVLGIGGLLLAWFFFSGHSGLFFSQRVAQAVPTEKSIAVLPFENISANKDETYFADGVQDEILANVARISTLKVISRTSVMQYRPDAKRDLRQIANALGVANILEGTVRRAGNRVRITIELVDTATDHTIWSETYDRDLIDIFAIQSEVAETVARKLTATLSPEEKKRIETKPTDSLEAYDFYLRAKELVSRGAIEAVLGSDEPLRDAIGLLEQAVRLDPKFTLAYCASAQIHGLLYFRYPSPERRALGDAAIANALRLQPDLPEVRLAYAFQLYFCYGYPDYERIREQLAIAKRGLTNSAEVFRLEAWMDRRQGNWEKAIQELNESIARDPRNILSIHDLADTTCLFRQFSASEKAYGMLIELLPDKPILKVEKALIPYFKSGDDGPARSAIAALPASMADDMDLLSFRLDAALADRDWQQAKEIIEKLKGSEDVGQFAYGRRPVPAGTYSIFVARLQGETAGSNPSFAEVREQLNQKVEKSQDDANSLSVLAVVDALLDNKVAAVFEGKRAVEILPISKDALDGPAVMTNLALVYAWTDEFDETLVPLTKMPSGVFYAQLKLDPYWDPLRKDPRFDKLLAELAPKD
jgi:TolB-like protein/cytochrome c-type biogenesis protein CcmH/NrfG